MKKELNLECPYKVSLDTDKQSYYFTTKSNLNYKAYFTDADGYFRDFHLRHNIFMFGFEYERSITQSKKKIFDKNTHLTIVAILKSFFENKDNVLIFVADISDLKHKARNRLFERWKKEYDFENNFDKYDVEIEDEEDIYFSSMIVSQYNIHKLEYKEAFLLSSNNFK